MVRVVRLERTVSWSQTRRDTSFAIPGYLLLGNPEILLSVVIAVVKGDFGVVYHQYRKPTNARVSTAFAVSAASCSNIGTALPKADAPQTG